jgi:hemoglobin-like flavoprotein
MRCDVGVLHGGDMSPEQIDAVEESLTRLEPELDDVVCRFYERLFELDPESRVLFPDRLEQLREKFRRELTLILLVLRRPDELLARAQQLAASHRDRGVRADHFRSAGTALIGALADTLGDEWRPELRTAWERAYHLTAEAMLMAMTARVSAGPFSAR